MPIANCLVAPPLDEPDPERIVAAWVATAGIGDQEMTVNVLRGAQGGKRYAVMAWLYLPSLWSEQEVTVLSEGLEAALSEVCGVASTAVQVVTCVVPSGSVVEGGETLHW